LLAIMVVSRAGGRGYVASLIRTERLGTTLPAQPSF
jgi:hypothetical protein